MQLELTTVRGVVDIYLEKAANLNQDARGLGAHAPERLELEATAEAYEEICAVLSGLLAAGRCR